MKSTLAFLRRIGLPFAVAFIAFGIASCGKEGSGNGEVRRDSGKIMVVTTTTMITDLVRKIAGDSLDIQPLMGPGVDPHLYKPTPEDMSKLSKCQVVVYVGLHLEGRMVEVFKHLNDLDKLTIALGEQLPQSELIRAKGTDIDPHVWGDAKLWAQTVNPLVAVLSKAMPSRKEEFERNGREAQKELIATHEWLKHRAEELLRKDRILVTSHDAFRYFGRAYGFEVVGVQGISTDSEAGFNDIAKIVDLIKEKKVKAVFIESSVPPATINTISKSSGAQIGGELLSDACGLPGEMVDVGGGEKVDRGTLIGMLKSNMHIVVTALKP